MGLLKHLLFWPVTGPKFLIDFSLGRVEGVVREQLTDDTEVKAELLELQLLLELGDIDDDEYVVREAALMQRLRDIREWRERFGMGVSGGPVKVAASEEESPAPESAPGTPAPAPEGTPAPSTAPAPAPEEGPRVARPGDATIEFHLDWE